MCGIIGIVGKQDVAAQLVEGLKRLEYRGYDSAGIATLVNGGIDRRRAEGKLVNLENKVKAEPLSGTIGIGHTRWATHGGPTERNAHPHSTDKVAIVHNGIIENYQELKAELESFQVRFESDTDTEIVAQLVTHYIKQGMTPTEAVSTSLKRLEGAFSLAMIFSGQNNLMIGARRGTPLAVGYGDGEMYIASDAVALSSMTNKVCYLEDGDWVEVTRKSVIVRNAANDVIERPVRLSTVSGAMISKGGYRHFMLKEIHEQPEVISETLNGFIHPSTNQISLPDNFDLSKTSRLSIIGCGTAFYAGMISKYWFEQLARLPVELDIASEFRYREAPLPENGSALFISQSGETLDTLEALRYCKRQKQNLLSIINVQESTIARESDAVLYTHAGPEIGVASTKGFITQLATLACLSIHTAHQRGHIDAAKERELALALRELPGKISEALHKSDEILALAHQIQEARDVLYMGRGTNYPLAMEGALKLKEISYIHAEGYAAGEMKHGPIALIDESVPVIVIAPHDSLFEKTASNIQEVAARGGKVLLISDSEGIKKVGKAAHWSIEMPKIHSFVAPLLYTVPIQLLAYHVAVLKGTDVDQPRNLAKSVTVE